MGKDQEDSIISAAGQQALLPTQPGTSLVTNSRLWGQAVYVRSPNTRYTYFWG